MNRFWESCLVIYMNIIFYLKNFKKTSTGNKKFKKFVPTFRRLKCICKEKLKIKNFEISKEMTSLN